VQRERLRDLLDIPDRYKIIQVLALGKPVEEIVIEPVRPGAGGQADIRYWRDEKGVHHVPKRRLEELIL
jgi:nitroreductase